MSRYFRVNTFYAGYFNIVHCHYFSLYCCVLVGCGASQCISCCVSSCRQVGGLRNVQASTTCYSNLRPSTRWSSSLQRPAWWEKPTLTHWLVDNVVVYTTKQAHCHADVSWLLLLFYQHLLLCCLLSGAEHCLSHCNKMLIWWEVF